MIGDQWSPSSPRTEAAHAAAADERHPHKGYPESEWMETPGADRLCRNAVTLDCLGENQRLALLVHWMDMLRLVGFVEEVVEMMKR